MVTFYRIPLRCNVSPNVIFNELIIGDGNAAVLMTAMLHSVKRIKVHLEWLLRKSLLPMNTIRAY